MIWVCCDVNLWKEMKIINTIFNKILKSINSNNENLEDLKDDENIKVTEDKVILGNLVFLLK